MHNFLGPSDPKLTHSIPRRPRLIKANPFLEHFTVADLKGWADRKMRGPNLRLTELLAAADAMP